MHKTTAIVVYNGVLVDEAEIFHFVLSRIPEFTTITVGVVPGQVSGPGGVETADAALHDVGRCPEIIAIPGGLGCHRQAEIGRWLGTVSPRWIITSSTGSALLAAAGLLRDSSAATHWLAGDILERHGAHPSREPVVVDGPIVTSSGLAGAFRAALMIANTYGGPELVARIRAEAANIHERRESPRPMSAWARLLAVFGFGRSGADRGGSRLPDFDDDVPLDLGMLRAA